MKKIVLLSIIVCIYGHLKAQETLHTITTRGALTTNAVTVGLFNSRPSSLPLGSAIILGTPGSNVGVIIVKGDGLGGKLQRWDTYINTDRSYVLGDRTAAGAVKDRLSIDTLGNIGINTLTPKERLSVRGKIRAVEIKVEADNWPDYVFEKDYHLQSLQEIEDYININGHLQDMPTAAEVANEGIALGELNAKLLKKVEELTLHLIQLEKDNKDQQKEIDRLKTRL